MPGGSSAAATVSKPLKEKTNTRFTTPITSPEREKAAKGVIPANTEASIRWAIKNFNSWALNRSAANPDDFVPPDLLKSHDAALVCKWLCRYAMATRREDGTPYPPTVRLLLSGVNRTLQSNNAPFSILDKNNLQFCDLIKTLDTVSSSLHKMVLVLASIVLQSSTQSMRICSGREVYLDYQCSNTLSSSMLE